MSQESPARQSRAYNSWKSTHPSDRNVRALMRPRCTSWNMNETVQSYASAFYSFVGSLYKTKLDTLNTDTMSMTKKKNILTQAITVCHETWLPRSFISGVTTSL